MDLVSLAELATMLDRTPEHARKLATRDAAFWARRVRRKGGPARQVLRWRRADADAWVAQRRPRPSWATDVAHLLRQVASLIEEHAR